VKRGPSIVVVLLGLAGGPAAGLVAAAEPTPGAPPDSVADLPAESAPGGSADTLQVEPGPEDGVIVIRRPGADSTRAGADSTAAIDGYLDELADRRRSDFALEALSVSDAEVDSLLRAYAATGRGLPAGATSSAPAGWELGWEIAALRYNRAEGVNVMPAATVRAPTDRELLAAARVGYAWAAEEPTWRGELVSELSRRVGRPTVTLTHERDVFAYGAGGLPGNSLLALTVAEDYNDYYLGEGWSAALSFVPGPLALDFSVGEEKQESIGNNATFALFEDGKTKFRPNPGIDDGTVRSFAIRAAAGDATYGRLAGNAAWTRAGYGLGGDWDYDTVRGEILGRQPLWLGDEVKVRLVGAVATGDTPYQATHQVGGTRLLRGYDINEFQARQVAVASVDYKIGTNLLQWLPYLRAIRVQFVPYFDAAALFAEQERDGTVVKPARADWRMAAGVGFQHNLLGIPGGTGQVRLDLTRRLDRGSDNLTWRLGFTWER
jgi:hypothetical protein